MSALPSSPRLEFCWWTEDDLPLARSLWRDAEVMRYLGGVMSVEQVEERLKLEMDRARSVGVQYWTITSQECLRWAYTLCGGSGAKAWEKRLRAR